jgi:hypothetical protein
MKKASLFFSVIAFALMPILASSQDTTVVQTFTFSDITKRRDVFEFPPSTESFRKILMYKTLKCDAATTQDNYPCGEWDYLAYTFLYDHTGVMDSNLTTHPKYLFGGFDVPSASTHTSSMMDIYQWNESQLVVDSIIDETAYIFSNGSGTTSNVFSDKASGRFQFIIKAATLIASGLSADTIDRINLNLSQLGGDLDHLTIRFRNYTFNSLSKFEEFSLTKVYEQNTNFTSTGLQILNLSAPFVWNGSANLLVDISYSRSEAATENVLTAQAQADSLALFASTNDDGYVVFQKDRNRIEVPLDEVDFGDEITISFWVRGDENSLPANTSVVEAVDFDNVRALNAHLPWSNGSVYWDAGSGAGYDRINKAANVGDYEGNWNHWAFTKNAATGQMKIYLNGVVWQSGNGLTRTLGVLKKLIIGSGMDQNPFFGKMDEFQIWKKELSASEIAGWMNRDITTSHPSYSDLVVYFKFDNGFDLVNSAPSSVEGYWHGVPSVTTYSGNELFRLAEKTNITPYVALLQGNYFTTESVVLRTDTVVHPPFSVVEYAVNGHSAKAVNGTYENPEGYSYVYNPSGQAIDSTFFAGTNQWVNSDLSFYQEPFEIVDRYEIGRFITPYGIGLSLGSKGFTWAYDVTDYAFLLHDMVDLSSGNQQELLDLKFVMIEGTPPAPVVELTRPWGQSRSISYAALDNDQALEPTTINVHPNAARQKVLARFTGHGHNSNTGDYPHCCEWKDNTHYLYVNNVKATEWHVWQTHDCALNPVYPQGGTWPGAREGWCPGDVVKDYEYDVTSLVSGSSYQLDYRITPVPSNNAGMGGGNYVAAMHVFQYGQPAQTIDAELYNVLQPSKVGYYSRMNPVCNGPKVTIKNNGSTTLTSLKIIYSVSGGISKGYNWTGSLGFLEKEEVELPFQDGAFYLGDGTNRFIAEVSEPNGGADGNSSNDRFTSKFNLPPVYEGDVIVQYKTNTFQTENTLTIYNSANQPVLERNGNSLAPNTVYWDTLKLDTGCYRLELTDSEDDGLSYWAWPNQGSGYLRVWNSGGVVKTFEAEFGNKLEFAFSAGAMTKDTIFTTIDGVDVVIIGGDTFELINGNLYPLGVHALDPFEMNLYPNPNNGSFYLEMLNYFGEVGISIMDISGQLVHSSTRNIHGSYAEKFNFQLQSGVYLVQIKRAEKIETRKIIVQ